MHLRLRKCEKSPQTYCKLADLRLRNPSCSFAEFAVAELSVNLRCPALQITYVEVEAAGFSRFHFHRFRFHIPAWNRPSFTVESIFSSPCSRSDPHLFCQGAALAHLDSLLPHDLALWTDGSVPFPFGKGGSGVLANCSLSVALRPLFPFRQAQFAQVFPLKPTPFCTLFAGLGSTNKSAIFLLFSYYLTLVLSSPPCPLLHLSSYLKLCGRSGRNCLLSPRVLLGYNRSPSTRFSRETTRLMSWPDGVRYLRSPLSLVVSLILPLVSTLVICRTGCVRSHLNSLTHRFPQFPLRNLCSLVMLAVSSLVYATTDTVFF